MDDEASSRRRRNKENCDLKEQGDYVSSGLAGRGCPTKNQIKYADVAELADALDSGSSESDFIWVRVPSSAPNIQAGDKSPACMFFDE